MNKKEKARLKAMLAGSMHYTFRELADLVDKHRTTLYSTLGYKNIKHHIVDMIKSTDNHDANWSKKLYMVGEAKRNLMNLKEIVEQLIEIENERCRNYLEKIQL
jgi:hypothetical protein